MESGEKIGSAQAEIEILKRRISELESISKDKLQPEVIKDAIKEHADKISEEVLADEYRLKREELDKQTEQIGNLKASPGFEDEHKKKTAALLQLANDKGVLNAVSVAKNLNDPHLEDDFHDALVKFFQGFKNV